MDFNSNIFINCPFDEDYYPLLRPLLYTIIVHGYNPRIALENSDSGKPRLEKLKELIGESRYSIHDLSRIQAGKKKEYYRLNMPFELGIDFGYRYFVGNGQGEKRFLILEKENYRYMRALSDINGLDIKSHENEPQKIIKAVRNWFVETVGVKDAKSPSVIWYDFIDFNTIMFDNMTNQGFTKDEIDFMPIPELKENMTKWINEKKLVEQN